LLCYALKSGVKIDGVLTQVMYKPKLFLGILFELIVDSPLEQLRLCSPNPQLNRYSYARGRISDWQADA
jgi:hypothetical protein